MSGFHTRFAKFGSPPSATPHLTKRWSHLLRYGTILLPSPPCLAQPPLLLSISPTCGTYRPSLLAEPSPVAEPTRNTDELTMPPTITADKDNAEPSAPPLTDSIPVVAAYAISNDEPATSASLPPRPPPNVAVPQGMVAKTVTTKYADGREVTVTEYHPADTSNGVTPAPAATTSTATAAPSNYVPPRRDLGSVPVTFTCPFCSHAGPTRTRADCGDCTWISVIILLLCCFPFFWVPFVCNNVSNVMNYEVMPCKCTIFQTNTYHHYLIIVSYSQLGNISLTKK